MTQEVQTTERADEAFVVHEHIIATKNALTKNFLRLGELFYSVWYRKLYRALGHTSFPAYVAAPEIALSPSSVYGLMDIYRKFLVRLKIPETKLLPIGRKKLEMILPVVDETCVEKWLARAESLSTNDLRRELDRRQKKQVFEYKYTKQTNLQFEGDTDMERLLQKRLALTEFTCPACKKYFWTEREESDIAHCPWHGHSEGENPPGINGHIIYKDNPA